MPEASAPNTSVTRPLGIPPTPSAWSREMEPVGMASTRVATVDFPSFITAPGAKVTVYLSDGKFQGLRFLGRQVTLPVAYLSRRSAGSTVGIEAMIAWAQLANNKEKPMVGSASHGDDGPILTGYGGYVKTFVRN